MTWHKASIFIKLSQVLRFNNTKYISPAAIDMNTLRSGIVIRDFLTLTTCLLVDKVTLVGFKASRTDFFLTA